jgi:hypothetical protein
MISHNEWVAISRQLEDKHAIFEEMWQMGRPVFTDEIETAAVSFSHSGEFIDFMFNETYWKNLTLYEQTFVISHECLHVILNHGVRTKQGKDAPRINRALDIVVNHLLVNSFDFDRKRIRDEDVLCWTDTVFKDNPNVAAIPTNESYEYYLQLVPESLLFDLFTLDDHSFLGKDADKIIEKLNGRLSEEDKQTLKDMIEKYYSKGSSAGNGCGSWTFRERDYTPPKRKWESVIHKWSQKYLRGGLDEHEQWARLARRFELIENDIMLPSEMEDESKDFDRIPVYLFLDTSGSCWKYKERFFRACESLPSDRFLVRLFCFDTKVEETTLESGKIYGGGGTAFHIIEGHIQKLITKEKAKYPEGVFLITDGIGNQVNPEYPERWHWFLAGRATKRFIPEESKTYRLEDFE